MHPSSLTDNKKNKIKIVNDFERLEFLGDRVLGLAISSIIYKKFTQNNEGDLSKKLSYLVQKNFLHKISIDLKIDEILNFSFKKNEKMNISILADSIESLIGAIYLDGGFANATRVELTPINSQTLDGSTDAYVINKEFEGIQVWSDGVEWFIIQKKA